MNASHQLIGTGTVVAAATTGLVFGQPSDSTASRPTSNKRKLASGFESQRLPASSRPGTSTATDVPPFDYHPRTSFQQQQQQYNEPLPAPLSSHPPAVSRPPPTNNQITPPKSTSRRQSFIRQTDIASRPIAENARDSVSSNGSWMRRLSIRPLSQHGSPRSSMMGPESPSFIFSQGSGAPMLSPAGSASPQLPPNKLIKRLPSTHNTDSPGTTGRGSKSQVPTFRRPATSHQRSATLQQYHQQGGFPEPPPVAAKFSFDQTLRPRASTVKAEVVRPEPQLNPSGWASFFHFRVTRTSRGSSGSPNGVQLPNKRIEPSYQGTPRACLVKPSMLGVAATTTSTPKKDLGADTQNANGDSPHTNSTAPDSPDTPEDTPSKKARRSISMHFGSPGNWISKTGSIRRPKRGSPGAKNEGKRHVSAPTATKHNPVQPEKKSTMDETLNNSREPRPQLGPESAASNNYHPKARKRNSSSPLPQISRLSSFNIDVSHLGLATTPATGTQRPNQTPVTYFANSRSSTSPARSRGVSGENSSTVASSDLEARDFMSGDDDDTDFKSDIMFDSFRTTGSNRVRNVDTPLESMFDESPPSTAGNSKTKRLSIQEILGQSWDSDTKIMEEDESAPTPSRTIRADVRMDVDEPFGPALAPRDLSLSNRDFGRLSLDDDDDEDWARDEESGLTNHLFPPSSSLNSRKINPRLRHALASISGNSTLDSRHLNTVNERPRSNIFDWTEPILADKIDVGQSPRPKTVHGKQEMDMRGGRAPNRKGPGAGHVRSQSVPVVPEPTDGSKTVPKFGTWGLGTKGVSEDWDDDFDFDEELESPVGAKDSATSFSMVVPASIQATQPTVKAHSGQIRELSLLVNDLKRLCRHGKDLDILDGHSSLKWKEAQNIIELASPDEDEDDDEDKPIGSSNGVATKDPDAMTIDERIVDEGFDASSLERVDDPFTSPQPEMAKNAVVRERQAVRRRSVFSPEDDIFGGNWPLSDDNPLPPTRPRTPDQQINPHSKSAMISTVMEAMQQQRSTSDPVQCRSPVKPSQSKLFFDTNSLQELVKKAGQLRDSLSDMVRRAELLTQSPAGTPRRERVPRLSDGSPAFTRVFTDPASSPPKRLPKSHSNNSVLSRTSVDSPRLQMMTVN